MFMISSKNNVSCTMLRRTQAMWMVHCVQNFPTVAILLFGPLKQFYLNISYIYFQGFILHITSGLSVEGCCSNLTNSHVRYVFNAYN